MDKQVFATNSVTDFWTTNKEGRLGDLRWLGNKCYRWVINDSLADFVTGRVYYGGAAAAAEEFHGHAFALGQATKSTDIDWPLGIAVSPIPSTQYGWLQCYGEYASIGVEGTTAVAIGDSLVGVSGQTYLVKEAVVTAGTPNPATRKAFALAAQGSAGVAATRGVILML